MKEMKCEYKKHADSQNDRLDFGLEYSKIKRGFRKFEFHIGEEFLGKRQYLFPRYSQEGASYAPEFVFQAPKYLGIYVHLQKCRGNAPCTAPVLPSNAPPKKVLRKG